MLLLPDTGRHHLKLHLQIFLPSFVRARGRAEDAQGSSLLHQPSINSEVPSLTNTSAPGTFTHKSRSRCPRLPTHVPRTVSPSPCRRTSYILASFTLEPRSSTLLWTCRWVSSWVSTLGRSVPHSARSSLI